MINAIKNQMQALRLSESELARRCGMKQPAVNRALRTGKISLCTLQKFCLILELEIIIRVK